MPEHLAHQILAELRTISDLLRRPSHTTEPSEHQETLASKLSCATVTTTAFEPTTHADQPTPPVLPTIIPRTKWTQEMEDIIHEAADAQPNTYRNSVKRIFDKLPKGIPMTSLRNKCNKLGYSIKSNYITKKDN